MHKETRKLRHMDDMYSTYDCSSVCKLLGRLRAQDMEGGTEVHTRTRSERVLSYMHLPHPTHSTYSTLLYSNSPKPQTIPILSFSLSFFPPADYVKQWPPPHLMSRRRQQGRGLSSPGHSGTLTSRAAISHRRRRLHPRGMARSTHWPRSWCTRSMGTSIIAARCLYIK